MKSSARSLSTVAALTLCTTILQACGDGSTDPISVQAPAARAPAVPIPVSAPKRWIPVASETWQWQLKGKLDTSYDVAIYDIDLFDTDETTIAALKQAGRKVVCYFSAGSSENWRSDFAMFKASDQGKKLDDWEGERWLDVRSSNVRDIMTARLDRAASKGCDGVEPDNVDGYANDTGFPLQDSDQYAYNAFLASEAHKRNLAIGLKNDVDQLSALEPSFDFAVNEECHEKSECGGYKVFTSKNKPVLNAEYSREYRSANIQRSLCEAVRAADMRTLVLSMELDGSYRFSCDDF